MFSKRFLAKFFKNSQDKFIVNTKENFVKYYRQARIGYEIWLFLVLLLFISRT